MATSLLGLHRKAWHLASEGYADFDSGYRKRQEIKILLNVTLHPFFALKWFDLLESPQMQEIFCHRPRLYIKPFRPYLSIRWHQMRKVKVILDSYRLMRAVEPRLYEEVLHHRRAGLLQYRLDDDCELHISLGYSDRFRKEGEFVLSLELPAFGGEPIVRLAFSLEEGEEGETIAYIGCVQGYRPDSKTMVEDAGKKTQKRLHGLRPKSFIVYLFQALMQRWQCSAIYCAGNDIQAHRKKHLIHIPIRHDINFDYDAFYREFGATKDRDGWFRLPLHVKLKDIESIKSKKRAMYRRRYALLEEILSRVKNDPFCGR